MDMSVFFQSLFFFFFRNFKKKKEKIFRETDNLRLQSYEKRKNKLHTFEVTYAEVRTVGILTLRRSFLFMFSHVQGDSSVAML